MRHYQPGGTREIIRAVLADYGFVEFDSQVSRPGSPSVGIAGRVDAGGLGANIEAVLAVAGAAVAEQQELVVAEVQPGIRGAISPGRIGGGANSRGAEGDYSAGDFGSAGFSNEQPAEALFGGLYLSTRIRLF